MICPICQKQVNLDYDISHSYSKLGCLSTTEMCRNFYRKIYIRFRELDIDKCPKTKKLDGDVLISVDTISGKTIDQDVLDTIYMEYLIDAL